MTYDQQTGNVVLTINQIGPGDEGEYTCSARNQYGEAICSVFIQPEGKIKFQFSKYIYVSIYVKTCWVFIGHTVQIPQGTYGSQRVQQTQNTLYTNNYSNIEEVNNHINRIEYINNKSLLIIYHCYHNYCHVRRVNNYFQYDLKGFQSRYFRIPITP